MIDFINEEMLGYPLNDLYNIKILNSFEVHFFEHDVELKSANLDFENKNTFNKKIKM